MQSEINYILVQWRNLQLNGLVSSQYEDFLLKIRAFLRDNFKSKEDLEQEVKGLASLYHRKNKQRLIIAVDEANILVEVLERIF